MNFWVQWVLNLNILPSWKLFYKNSGLPRNYNHSIWMSKTQLMTQTLRNTPFQGQNRTPDFNPNFRGLIVTVWSRFLLDNSRYGSHVSSQPRITQFGGLMAKLLPKHQIRVLGRLLTANPLKPMHLFLHFLVSNHKHFQNNPKYHQNNLKPTKTQRCGELGFFLTQT